MTGQEPPERLPTPEEIKNMTPGQRIFHYRSLRGYSQQTLAARMRLIAVRYRGSGVDRRQISRWESDMHTPDTYSRHLLAEALEVRVKDLGLPPNPYFR
ncbi:helix-turn-helix transcriptional regulator [Dactylosporangium darangshiense]|uniref:HTH cro/C1-type domain-containing protein n=1 Tax=Dactylosporangium darangshiense TaxID=579108 RepID=A0ABP8DI74_9ACTN